MVEPTHAEKELRQAAKAEPEAGQVRQDFLADLTRKVSKLSDDDIDQLNSGAQDWYDVAVDALNNKQPIPEIGDSGPIEVEADEPDERGGEDESATEAKTNGSAPPDQTDLEDATAQGATATDEAPAEASETDDKPAPAKGNGTRAKRGTKAAGGAKKAAAGQAKAKGTKAKADKSKTAEKPKKATGGGKDKFGCVVGSKRAKAAEMFEKGATMKDVRDAFDGNATFYNLLNKLKEAGHKVDRQEDGKLKLTHKDNA